MILPPLLLRDLSNPFSANPLSLTHVRKQGKELVLFFYLTYCIYACANRGTHTHTHTAEIKSQLSFGRNRITHDVYYVQRENNMGGLCLSTSTVEKKINKTKPHRRERSKTRKRTSVVVISPRLPTNLTHRDGDASSPAQPASFLLDRPGLEQRENIPTILRNEKPTIIQYILLSFGKHGGFIKARFSHTQVDDALISFSLRYYSEK